MSAPFRVLATPAFERDFRALARHDRALRSVFDELITILTADPHNRSTRYKIKKLAGVEPGEGQWRIRWRDYRLRYDIVRSDVVLYSFRHRKEAY